MDDTRVPFESPTDEELAELTRYVQDALDVSLMPAEPPFRGTRGAAKLSRTTFERLLRVVKALQDERAENARLLEHIKDLNHDMEAAIEGYEEAFESGYDCAERQ
jgi:hypothetical protein